MPTCQCGCGKPAAWLCTGSSPEGGFVDMPCCHAAARYLSDCCAEFELPFSKKPVETTP